MGPLTRVRRYLWALDGCQTCGSAPCGDRRYRFERVAYIVVEYECGATVLVEHQQELRHCPRAGAIVTP